MKTRYELRYADENGIQHVRQFEDIESVRNFYKYEFDIDFSTISFKSLKTGRTVE